MKHDTHYIAFEMCHRMSFHVEPQTIHWDWLIMSGSCHKYLVQSAKCTGWTNIHKTVYWKTKHDHMCDSFGKHMLQKITRKVIFCHATLFLTCTTSIFVNMDHFIDTEANPTKKQAKLRYTNRLTYANPKNRLRDKMLKGQLSALYKTALDNDFLIKTLPHPRPPVVSEQWREKWGHYQLPPRWIPPCRWLVQTPRKFDKKHPFLRIFPEHLQWNTT